MTSTGVHIRLQSDDVIGIGRVTSAVTGVPVLGVPSSLARVTSLLKTRVGVGRVKSVARERSSRSDRGKGKGEDGRELHFVRTVDIRVVVYDCW